MSKLTRSEKRLLLRAAELQQELKKMKELYKELDLIVKRLRDKGFHEAQFDGKVFMLHDNFDEENTAFRVARISRFELRIEDMIH